MAAVPLVSVILPFRNAARFISAALASLQAQDFADFEVIAVDDHSADRSADLVRHAARADARIRLTRSARPGLPHALNDGCRQARGRYLARMDADDIALPSRLSHQVAALEAFRDIVVVGGSVDLIDEDDRGVGEIWYAATDTEARAVLARGSTPFCHPAATIRREAFAVAGGYRGECELAEDVDLWLRLAPLGRLQNLDRKVLRYRLHPASSSYDRIRTQIRSLYRALVINGPQYGDRLRAWALETAETWRLVELWAGHDPAGHLGRITSWYVQQAVTAGYDPHLDALVGAIAGIAPPERQATIALMLWQAAAGAAVAAGRVRDARAYISRCASVIAQSAQLDDQAPALHALATAAETPLSVVVTGEAGPVVRTGGYLDQVTWFAGGTRAFVFGWIARPHGVPETQLRLHFEGPAPAHLSIERALRHDVSREMGPAFIIAGFKVDLRFHSPVDMASLVVRGSARYDDGSTASLEDANLIVRYPDPASAPMIPARGYHEPP